MPCLATSCLSPLCLSSSPSLDDIRGKLSQFDLYYYNYKFERSIRELRSNVMDYPNKTTANSRCIDNNLRQVLFSDINADEKLTVRIRPL
ncbi:unnamed protein product [Miscanthus lutarioriparius]|uniref:Uncharacterized protein n=1 Tax=Miscanthus lutarioriparius TaxID=422564 RepID=A0A811MXT4_9POAL|nr:unnamed protein product [Miscanthus lutarioriparius]